MSAKEMPLVLGLEIGDCLSRRDVKKRDGDQCWLSAAKGAYAFLVLFVAEYGPESLHVISKTSRGTWHSTHAGRQVEAWVVRFAKQFGLSRCGVPDTHIHVTSQKSGFHGKGPVAERLQLTHMVDNDRECLWSVLCDPFGNASATLVQCIQFTGLRRRDIRWPPGAYGMLTELEKWYDVARYFKLPGVEFWDAISLQGPPYRPPATVLPSAMLRDFSRRH